MIAVVHHLRAAALRPLPPPPPGVLVLLALVCATIKGCA
jgi:hypothetical protein